MPKSFAEDLALLLIRHGLSLSELETAIASQIEPITELYEKKHSQKLERERLASRNKGILRDSVRGDTYASLARQHGISKGCIAEHGQRHRRIIADTMLADPSSFMVLAQEYGLSPNEIAEVARARIARDRDALAQSLVDRDENTPYPANELTQLAKLNDFLNDQRDHWFIVLNRQSKADLHYAEQTSKAIIWT